MKDEPTEQTWSSLAADFGVAGADLTRLDAAEGSAGNVSVFVRALEGLSSALPPRAEFALPVRVPALAGGWVVVTGTGCRLRDLERAPGENLCALQIHEDGGSATLYGAPRLMPTGELNSHLAVHDDQVSERDLPFHAVVHAQPRFLTYLSHLSDYQEEAELNLRLARWEPETILTFPEGIATIPFQVPGSIEMMRATVAALRDRRALVWQKHGIMTRSDISLRQASDLVEYAEAAAHFEYLNLGLGGPSKGILPDELKRLRDAWGTT